jgi:hypothetical protein
MPVILFTGVFILKNIAPVIITKMGVNELSVPASALSIPFSARQNKYAGNKLPSVPDKNTSHRFFSGIFFNEFTATGNNTMPDETILMDAM